MPVSVFHHVFGPESWVFQGTEIMRNWIARAVFVAVAGFAVSAMAADWPHFLGPNSNGTSPETGINKAWNDKKPAQLWTVKMSDNGFAGPSVADGKVFIIDHIGDNDVIRAIDLITGKQVWETPYAEPGPPDQGNFARSTPTYDNGKLYTLSRLGLLNCYNAKDGKNLWSRNIATDFKGQKPKWHYSMSPIVDGNNLIVIPGGANACVAALNKESGATIWQGGGSDAPGYATPAIATIAGKKQYLVMTIAGLIGVDPADGKLLWSFPWKTRMDVNAAMPVMVGEDTIFITSGYGHGCTVAKIADGKAEKVWENKEIQSHFSTPVFFDGNIYGTTDPGDLVCLDPKTGKALWRQPGFEKGGIIVVDGTIIAMNGKDGDAIMVELKPDAYKELGRFKPIGGQSWTAPIIADGKLIIRNKATTLGCFDLK